MSKLFYYRRDGFKVRTVVNYDRIVVNIFAPDADLKNVSEHFDSLAEIIVHTTHHLFDEAEARDERSPESPALSHIDIERATIRGGGGRYEGSAAARTQASALLAAATVLDDFKEERWCDHVATVREEHKKQWAINRAVQSAKKEADDAARAAEVERVRERLAEFGVKLSDKALDVWTDVAPVFAQAIEDEKLDFGHAFFGHSSEGISSRELPSSLFGGIINSLQRKGLVERFELGYARSKRNVFLLLENGHKYFGIVQEVNDARSTAKDEHEKAIAGDTVGNRLDGAREEKRLSK